jgi:hypothetical protein
MVVLTETLNQALMGRADNTDPRQEEQDYKSPEHIIKVI